MISGSICAFVIVIVIDFNVHFALHYIAQQAPFRARSTTCYPALP
jgi:hypothetical protein